MKEETEKGIDMVGIFNIARDGVIALTATAGVYTSGDGFVWFMDADEFCVYLFMDKKLEEMLEFPLSKSEEFLEALKDMQQRLKDRGNPVTVQERIR